MRISGMTRLAGVVGNPVSHSLSPAMHNAAYEALGLDWVYLPLHVGDEMGLSRLSSAIRSMRFVGFNITMPYKAAMLELCDEVATAAEMAGAVNTVHCTDGKLIGYNTDGRGLLEALQSETPFVPAGADVVVLGAGGAAGAAIVGLVLAKVRSVTVVNRNLSHADELVERMSTHSGAVRLETTTFQQAEEAVRTAHLVVNATPIGMTPGDPSPIDTSWIGPGQIVYDMVYGGAESTALVSQTQAAGAVAVDGVSMLVAQGAVSVDIWNDNGQVRAPRDVMRSAACAALAERRGQG